MMRTFRWVAWSAVVVVAAATLALFLSDDVRQAFRGGGFEMPAIGGEFELVDHTGRTVTEEEFLGTPTLYFFGFTHCPDVCPTTLFEVSNWLQELGPEAEEVSAVFVSVDPERDTPEVLAEYISAFDERIVGLTGTPEQVDQITDAWRVYVSKVPGEGDSYSVDHTAIVYLMDSNGRFFGTIAYGEDEQSALGKLRRLIAEG